MEDADALDNLIAQLEQPPPIQHLPNQPRKPQPPHLTDPFLLPGEAVEEQARIVCMHACTLVSSLGQHPLSAPIHLQPTSRHGA